MSPVPGHPDARRGRGRRGLFAALGAIVLVVAAAPAEAAPGDRAPAPFDATVTRVVDGDTLWVQRSASPGAPPVKLRLLGLDAPERCQSGGTEATEALANRVLRRRVVVEPVGRDEHDRLLGRLRLDGADVGAWLVASGLAWSDGRGRSAGPYRDEQRMAQSAQRGVHADARALRPREFRQRVGSCP